MLLSLRLGEECNKNCPNCDYMDIKQPKHINYNLFQKQSKMVFEIINRFGLDYSITGGEPGLISTEIFDHLFSLTDKNTTIASNGLFMDNKLHLKYDERIKCIYYNCGSITDNKTSKYNYEKMEYYLLIDSSNLKFLKQYLLKNSDTTFTIKLVEQRGIHIPPLLSLDDLYSLLSILSCATNYDQNIIGLLQNYIKYIENNTIDSIRELCSKKCNTLQIDFVHNIIRKCYKSYTRFPTIELTKDNLIKAISNKIPEFNNFDDVCKTCTYLYKFSNISTEIVNRLKLSRHFDYYFDNLKYGVTCE